MPAVELNRLRKQADELVSNFHQPVEFKRMLLDRLEFYADRITRPGKLAKPAPLIPRFNVPDLFLQTVEQSLQNSANENPEGALVLAETLWLDPHLEPKLLAAALIGMAARHKPDAAASLLVQYCVSQENALVQEALLQHTGGQLRSANLVVWFDLVERWISSEIIAQQLIGFKALQGVINDRKFENLPIIFRLLTPPLEMTNRGTIHDLETLIILLARRTPVETAYFLRQCFMRTENPILARLVRKCIPIFPEEGQFSLRKTLQDKTNAVSRP